MARNDSPPFGRGEYEASANLDHLLGREYEFEDIDYASTAATKPHRSGKMVRVRLVKNAAGAALLPKRLAQFSTTAGADYYQARCTGYANTENQRSFPIDEFLPTAGAPDGSYFFVVVKGPAMCRTPVAGAGFNGADIAVGGILAALTAVTSGATTSGRVTNQIITGSSQATENNFIAAAALNAVGRALSAATTGQTNGDLLVDIGHW